MQQGDRYYGDARRSHQRGGGGAQAVERGADPLAVAKGLQERRHDENDDNGGGYQPDGGHQRAADAAGGEAYIGGHVHADGAGSGLRHRQHIRQLGVGKPSSAFRHILQEGQSGQPAAHGEQTGLEEFPEQLEVQHYCALLITF